MLGISTTNVRVGGFRGKGVDANAQTIFNRIIADGGVSNLTRLNFFVKGLKAIYGDLANVPVCYDAHWIGYKLGSGTGATAGQAAAKLYSLTVAGDAVQSTAASQPLLLSHNGASTDNYWWGSGVASNFVSTPDATANRITGDIEIIANFKLDSVSVDSAIIAKDNTGSRFYNLIYIGAGVDSGKIAFGRNIGGTFAYSISSVISGFTTSNIYWLKVNRSASTGDVKFFTSTDGITYTQLGATITSTAGVLTTGAMKVNVGSLSNDTANIIQGKIYRATISNSIGGAPVVDFNPAQYNASTSQTAWTSSTGEVWTINTGTATTGYKGVLVDRTIVQGDGVDDSLQTTTQYLPIDKSFYAADKYFSSNLTASSGGIRVLNGNFGQNNSTSRRMWFNAGNNEIVASTANIATLNLNTGSVASGDTKFRVNTGADTTSTVVFVSIISREVNIFNTFTICNAQLNTLVITNQVDTNSQKTATYNLIRSINNNAF